LSLLESNKLFEDKYLSENENIFEAINIWSNDSEKLKAKYQNRLSSNEALSAILNGNLPDNLDRRIMVRDSEKRYADRYIQEALTQIDDYDIKVSVSQSMSCSRSENHLVFVYLDSLTEAQKARVRVISRLIWYNLYPTKGK